jgi:hypothetical protein
VQGNRKIGPDDVNVVINFGGGLHTRASTDDIDPREAASGSNFLLDLENRDLKPRPPFDLIGTVPNTSEIRGGGSLLQSDGTVSALFQAGDTVYEWDGVTTFTSRGTVNASAKLRGHWRTNTWALDDELLLTDLNLVETVKKWTGTALSSVTFTDENDVAFGTFYAKYVHIEDERAIFAHVKDPGATSRHMIVGSLRSDYTQITVTDRPASALSEEDPFFLLAPDLKSINGLAEAFGALIFSTEKGKLFKLTGTSAKDFRIDPFYAGSAASGEESLAYIGNDIIYGRQGRIESVTDTDRSGDSAADDLSASILDQIKDFTGWRIVFNSRLNRAYLFPADQSEVWVYDTALRGGQLSPWMRWRTSHALAFRPTFVMPMLDPADGLEYVFMGDASGNVYRLEGSGLDGDGGTSEITTEWLSKSFPAKLDAMAYDIEGQIRFRKNAEIDVELIFEYAGTQVFNKSITLTLPAVSGANYYGGGAYYGGGFYYGSVSGRVSRLPFGVPGQANEFQLRIKATGADPFAIASINLRLRQASG